MLSGAGLVRIQRREGPALPELPQKKAVKNSSTTPFLSAIHAYICSN